MKERKKEMDSQRTRKKERTEKLFEPAAQKADTIAKKKN